MKSFFLRAPNRCGHVSMSPTAGPTSSGLASIRRRRRKRHVCDDGASSGVPFPHRLQRTGLVCLFFFLGLSVGFPSVCACRNKNSVRQVDAAERVVRLAPEPWRRDATDRLSGLSSARPAPWPSAQLDDLPVVNLPVHRPIETSSHCDGCLL